MHIKGAQKGATGKANEAGFPALPPARRQKLIEICEGLGLSSAAIGWVTEVAEELQEFERHGKALIKTQRESAEMVLEIAKRADELHQLVMALPVHDLLEVVTTLEKLPERKAPVTQDARTGWEIAIERPSKPSRGSFQFSLASELARDLPDLARAASVYSDLLRPGKGVGGRRPMHQHYRHYISELWGSVEREGGFSLGRDGKFNRLCNAVFDAASIHAKADGAVRHFVKTKPAYDASIRAAFDSWDE
jgi:hypothetical protein